MGGLSTLLVELDDPAGSGAFPYNITPYVDLRAQWSLTRGRQDELGEVDPATAKLVLNNRDGRFTVGSAVYGGLVVDQRVRITEKVGLSSSIRITGNVQDWPVEFEDAAARSVPCRVTVVDRQARLARRPLPNPLRVETVADGPYAYYPMGDPVGAKTSEDVSGFKRRRLFNAGAAGSPFIAGVEGAGGTGYQFAGDNYLRTDLPSFACSSVGVWFMATSPPAAYGTLVRVSSSVVGTTSTLEVTLETNGTVLSTMTVGTGGPGGPLAATLIAPATLVNLCDGAPHFVYVYYSPDGATARLYVDGVLVQESTGGTLPAAPDKDRISIGLGLKSAAVLSHVSLYAGEVPAARVMAQFLSVVSGTEDSHERFARILGYAGVAPGDMALEAGVLTSTASQLLEKEKAAVALSAVAQAEGGLWFVRGDGDVALQNRTHRTYKASQPAGVALISDDVDHDDFLVTTDKQYLQNVATGSRVEGGTQESRNETSVNAYDEYPGGGDLAELLVTTDDEVKDRLDWVVAAYGQPLPRVNRVTIDLLTLPDRDKVAQLLALELGDRMTIAFLPPQSPIQAADLIVEGFEETQSESAWKLTFNTVSAALFRAWILGSAGYGVLGSTTRLYY